ncbi:MAG: chemotaxis protein CheW [Paracoccaceae bacterium]|jgi:purine-binding chemotaxis protein CheW|nr:chemotaxis protein CheW [Paracoccaceae bacterium]
MTHAATIRDAGHEPEAVGGAILLVFRLEGEAFGLSVDPVHEILDPPEITPVPNAGAFAPGLVNVRGVVVPVLDIRQRLRMPAAAPGPSARIIVLEHEIDGTPCRLAFVADAVEDVIEAGGAALDRMPEIGARWPPACIAGAIRHGPDLVVLLEPSALFAPDAAEAAA